MIEPETEDRSRRRRQAALRARSHQADCPDKFRAIAEWHRIEAKGSAMPEQHSSAADAQDAIANDMEHRPGFHRVKPLDRTRYQWSKEP